jgi:hypothetical protein
MNGEGGRFGRVDPNAIVLGVAVAIAVIVIGAGIAIYVSADSGRGAGQAASISTDDDSTTTTRATSTTTTLAPTTTSTTGVLPNTGESTGTPSPPPTDRATSDPEDDPFVPVPLPLGVAGATIDSCLWSPSNGGELQASGTITGTAEDDLWGVEVYWLQNDRELDSQYEIYDFATAGQTVPWRLTVEAPLSPLDLRCAIIVD